ncbi:MAG: hypothetical protein WA130_02870 [Candidatus Methanoperedens sp.]
MNIETLITILGLLSGVLTPFIAIIAAYIAIQQYKLKENEERLALYDKRFSSIQNRRKLIGLYNIVPISEDKKQDFLKRWKIIF